jgi:hypothetical protein
MSADGTRCGQCGGVRIAGGDSCLAHAKPTERAAALKQFSETGDLDIRGVAISDALLKEIFNAAPHNADGRPAFSAIQCDKATFEGDAEFGQATFEGDAGFGGATFKGDAEFGQATFKGDAVFSQATFEHKAQFFKARFGADARFRQATFKGLAGFEATFEGDAVFYQAKFEGDDWLGHARFKGVAGFSGAIFDDDATFSHATFEAEARFSRATFKGKAEFDQATFEGDAVFGGATFKRTAEFSGATFKSSACFKATFEGPAVFSVVTFDGNADFSETIFERSAYFSSTTFKGEAQFSQLTFKRDAGFGGASFKGDAWFHGATFEGDAGFYQAKFEDYARFSQTTFKGHASFGQVSVKRSAQFTGAKFEGDVPALGPLAAEKWLDLDRVQFASAVRIEADAEVLTCCRGRFPGGVRFDVRRAVVRLDDSDLSIPALLTGPPVSSPAGVAGQPKLLSLQGANVAGLALGNVSLANCWFAGAHNLDKLRLEAGTTFGNSPVPSVLDHRQVIAEEAAWRAARARPGRWSPPEWPYFDDKPEVLSPGAVAVLYRALRKSREDGKDEPGAADFYYGEMEMRRHERGTRDAIRWRGHSISILLWAYWLVSGYGLRAARSIAALTVVMALFAAAFYFIGFTKPPEPATYWTSLLYAFRSTISLTDSQVTLTAWGSFFQALLRITGPVLLGLTLLALRNRVKR